MLKDFLEILFVIIISTIFVIGLSAIGTLIHPVVAFIMGALLFSWAMVWVINK